MPPDTLKRPPNYSITMCHWPSPDKYLTFWPFENICHSPSRIEGAGHDRIAFNLYQFLYPKHKTSLCLVMCCVMLCLKVLFFIMLRIKLKLCILCMYIFMFVCMFACSSRKDIPISTKLGMISSWDPEENIGRSKVTKISWVWVPVRAVLVAWKLSMMKNDVKMNVVYFADDTAETKAIIPKICPEFRFR
jgi:hypothetical protein